MFFVKKKDVTIHIINVFDDFFGVTKVALTAEKEAKDANMGYFLALSLLSYHT